MKVMIVGLGLMGGSYAEGLKQKGYDVYGLDLNEAVFEKAKAIGLIHKMSSLEMISKMDLVILALYPKDNVSFLKRNIEFFNEKQLLTDISGTKAWMMHEIDAILKPNMRYLSHHPMAGRETSGFDHRDETMFKGANAIIVLDNQSSKKDMEMLRKVLNDLEFGKITVTDPKTHDDFIAYTSQLTHILAVALVNGHEDNDVKDATGDSYRDLTRIAKINETMWTELFLENKDALLSKIDQFKQALNDLEVAIKEENALSLKEMLKKAKEKRKTFDEH
ncbi:MAG: prephenate dehydrogenase/arogenate dehydrogenase family protein [Tenericutes bacterium HGW-Tenericutes-6]|jgi:prephenate dehydrogenase|nr:MAG: prephenate dehydrogenase/arogenate dehydrogenase family protein [Tenericutes bacterium HGW-Tenericutes-6]